MQKYSNARARLSETDDIERILDGAKACVARLGFERTRMEYIAAEAGISRATLYRRFAGKEEVFAALLDREALPFIARARVIAAESCGIAERIETILCFAIDEFGRHDWLSREMTSGLSSQSLGILNAADRKAAEYAMLPLLREGMAAGEILDALPSDELVEWIFRQLVSISVLDIDRAAKHLRVRLLIMPVLASASARA